MIFMQIYVSKIEIIGIDYEVRKITRTIILQEIFFFIVFVFIYF